MELSIVLDQPFWFDGKRYSTRYPFSFFIIELSNYVDRLVLFIPLKESTVERGDFPINFPNNVTVIPFPFFYSLKELYKNIFTVLPTFIKIFLNNINRFDTCGFIDGNIISLAGYFISRVKSKNVFIYIRANVVKAYSLQHKSFMGKIVGNSLGYFEDFLSKIMIKKNLTFVIGDELYRKYHKNSNSIHLYYANLISKDLIKPHIVKGIDKIKGFNILTVGRLVPQKGLEYLVYAINTLVKNKKVPLCCYVVGTGVERLKLENLVKEKKIDQHFKFLGNVTWGENLFHLYRQCDIFVSTSLTEGFPKTIFEAMTFGVAVIATNVGGVGGIVKNGINGLLISPKDDEQIVEGILYLYDNPIKHKQIVRNGYLTASEYTIENQQKKLISIIKKHFKSLLSKNGFNLKT